MRYARRLYHEAQQDDVLGLAAELAYRFLFALFPFFIFLAALGAYAADWFNIQNPTERIMDELSTSLPSDAASVVRTQLEAVLESGSTGLLSFGALAAIWAASSAAKTIMKAMNRAYDVEESRSFLKKQALGLVFTVLAGTAFIGGVVVLVVGQIVGQDIAAQLGLADAWAVAVNVARIPIVLLVLLAAISFVYWAAPNASIPFRWVSPGAIAFVIVWLIATYGFGFYVSNFGSYSDTYGALGGVIVLMLWLYITSLVIVLGAEINAIWLAAKEPESAPETVVEKTREEEREERRPATPARPAVATAEREPEHRSWRSRLARNPLSAALGAAVAAVVLRRVSR